MSTLKTIRWSARAGFTLIELMAAMVITAIGVFAAIQLQLVSIRGNSYAQERSGAQEIANGVAEELMTQSLQWVQIQNSPAVTFASIFQSPAATIVPNTSPPSMGTTIPIANLQAITMYNGNTIATSTAPGSAQLTNTAGCTAAPPACAGVVYRVHYIAQTVFLSRGNAQTDQDLVRITVFVSWDSKDYGLQNYSYSDWLINFWNRHMVAVTFFMSQTQLF